MVMSEGDNRLQPCLVCKGTGELRGTFAKMSLPACPNHVLIMNTLTPDYELLRDAHAIIDGIPDTAVAFGKPCTTRGPSLDNGTVCSPEGWLALHPQFIARGLTLAPDGTSLLFNGERMAPVAAMGRVFGLPEDEAARLFGERSMFAGEETATHASDKQLWLRRVRHHIHSRALSGTLATMAMAPAIALTSIAMAPAVTLSQIAGAIKDEPQ
jgi:hypothetical protein